FSRLPTYPCSPRESLRAAPAILAGCPPDERHIDPIMGASHAMLALLKQFILVVMTLGDIQAAPHFHRFIPVGKGYSLYTQQWRPRLHFQQPCRLFIGRHSAQALC